MRRAAQVLPLSVFVVLVTASANAQEAQKPPRPGEGLGLTIYSTLEAAAQSPQPFWNPATQRWEQPSVGFAIVKDWRKLRLEGGRNTVRFTDVAREIDASTVHFKSLTDPDGTTVLEQNFEYDLINADKILGRYIDRPITVIQANDARISGTLLSFDGSQMVLEVDDSSTPIWIIQRQENVRNIQFSALPGGLITRPTLVWDVQAAKAGEQLVNVTYETKGMRWNADYTVVTSPDDKAIGLAGWVTITNQSGALYKDAELKLVAGDVHRAPPPGTPPMGGPAADRSSIGIAESTGFVEKAFFEYHLYTLGRTTTLPDNSIKQIELFDPVSEVPARKIFLYYGGVGARSYGGEPYMDRNFGITSNKKVDIYLEFKNGKEQKLGIPLPGGRVRVFKKDEADASLEFVGEDRIDHTPRDEKVLLKLGSAFDIVAERKQTDFVLDLPNHRVFESFEIRVRNHKDEDVEVVVKENLYRWVNWEIEKKSHEFEKQDARTVHFPLAVKQNGETVLTYTVRYWW